MFSRGKFTTYNEVVKRVNYQLTSNFFTLEEFQNLPKRKAYKVIKLIAKINDFNFTNSELKDITFILLNLNRKTKDVKKINVFFGFNIELSNEEKQTIFVFIKKLFSFIFTYRLNREKVYLN